jgi:hypothetical protein
MKSSNPCYLFILKLMTITVHSEPAIQFLSKYARSHRQSLLCTGNPARSGSCAEQLLTKNAVDESRLMQYVPVGEECCRMEINHYL